MSAIYLNAAEVRDRYHASNSWIDRRTKEHGFPKPLKLGGPKCRRLWAIADLDAWDDKRRSAALPEVAS